VGLAVVAAVVALIVSLFLPPSYEAEALVLVTRRPYQMRFEPRFETLALDKQALPYDAYVELAESNGLQEQLFEVVQDQLPADASPSRLGRQLDVEQGRDDSLIKLTAVADQAEQAASIANSWANLFVKHVNTLYDNRTESASFFETQLEQAATELQRVEAAMIDFQARNPARILQAQLDAQQNILAKYLLNQQVITLVIEDAKNIKARLSQREPNSTTLMTDELTTLLLEVNSLSSTNPEGQSIQLQLGDPSSVSDQTVAEQIALLDTLMAALQNKKLEVETSSKALEPEILKLQHELQEAIQKEESLDNELILAKETRNTLANKAKEMEIAAADNSTNQLRVASYAPVTEKPSGPNVQLNVVIAGALGLTVGLIIVLAKEWWDSSTARSDRTITDRHPKVTETHEAEQSV